MLCCRGVAKQTKSATGKEHGGSCQSPVPASVATLFGCLLLTGAVQRSVCVQASLRIREQALYSYSGKILYTSAKLLSAIWRGTRLASTFSLIVAAGAVWCLDTILHGDIFLCDQDTDIDVWGSNRCGGNAAHIDLNPRKVWKRVSSRSACAFLLHDGTVHVFGNERGGGNPRAVQGQLHHVKDLVANEGAFLALLEDGTVVSWGSDHCGGSIEQVHDELKNVQFVWSNEKSFAALRQDGTVVLWSDSQTRPRIYPMHARWMAATVNAFAAISSVDGASKAVIFTKGDRGFHVEDVMLPHLVKVEGVLATTGAFAFITRDATWHL